MIIVILVPKYIIYLFILTSPDKNNIVQDFGVCLYLKLNPRQLQSANMNYITKYDCK